MSPNTTIRVEPQELRDTGAQLRHSSADIQHINAELRHAVMELDTGCWPSGDAARLNAHFSEVEVAGRRRVQARDDLSDTLMRAADAFERADTTAVQQLMGLPSGWVETSSIVTGSAGLNSTALSTQLPEPASFLASDNETRLVWQFTLSPNALRLYAAYLQAAGHEHLDIWNDWLFWGGIILAIVGILVSLFYAPAGGVIAMLGIMIAMVGGYLEYHLRELGEVANYLTGLAEAADHLNEETVTITVYEIEGFIMISGLHLGNPAYLTGESAWIFKSVFENPSEYAQRWDAIPPINWVVKEEWSPSVVTAFHQIPGAVFKRLIRPILQLSLILNPLSGLLIWAGAPELFEVTFEATQ